jgi:dihydroorotase-like cyclic amidohydrolase
MAVPGFVKNVALDRMKGKRPSAFRALATAAAAGGVTAVLTYKALRA